MKGFSHNCNDRDLIDGQGTLQLKKNNIKLSFIALLEHEEMPPLIILHIDYYKLSCISLMMQDGCYGNETLLEILCKT